MKNDINNVTLNDLPTIELDDLALIICSDFVKRNKEILYPDCDGRIPFLKMNLEKRMKIIRNSVDHIL